MLVSELVKRSGVPLATIKYYLREGLLMPGEPMSATRSSYGDEHLRRIALIRALTDVAGLSVQKTAEVIRLMETPGDDVFEALGSAVSALPPYDESGDGSASDRAKASASDQGPMDASGHPDEFPLARAALERQRQVYDPEYPAVAQLERALAIVAEAGYPMSDERLDHYNEHIRAIAEYDIANIPQDSPAAMIEYAVIGTALYEPVLAALRRLAHQDIALRRFGEPSQ